MRFGSSLGIIGSLATTSMAQRTADVERIERETSDQSRVAQSTEKAEAAAAIDGPEKEEAIGDRDADGRRPWEFAHQHPAPPASEASAEEPPHAKDPHGDAGNLLDISG